MDRKTAASLVEESLKSIYAYAAARVTCREDAEDLGGNIIVALLENCDSIRNEEAFFAYLWSVADKTLKKYYRKKYAVLRHTTDGDLTLVSDDGDFTEEIEKREEINSLRRELSLLSKEHRECTVDYYINGMSCNEIAERHNLSVNMVKYYLFKTRKILKEGIIMERNFGEKSYSPVKFHFYTVCFGEWNREYHDMFRRKICGNILASAYYTPCTIRELSIELGISTVYMEDEVALLEKYGLMKNVGSEKYQSNLLIFDGGTYQEFVEKTVPSAAEVWKSLIPSIRGKLEDIRKIGFIGSQNSDSRLMWMLVYFILRRMYYRWNDKVSSTVERKKLCTNTTGTVYGEINDDVKIQQRYKSSIIIGEGEYSGYRYSLINMEGLPEKNQCSREDFSYLDGMIKEIEENTANSRFVCFTDKEIEALTAVLEPEIDAMFKMYCEIFDVMCAVTTTRAPKHLHDEVNATISSLLYFKALPYLSGALLDSGALELPDFDDPAEIYFMKD